MTLAFQRRLDRHSAPSDRESASDEPAYASSRQPGSIQPLGFLLALSRDWTIRQASSNCADWLGRSPEQLLGRALPEVASDAAIHALRNRLQYLRGEDAVERLSGVELTAGQPPLDLTIHRSGENLVLEGERSQADDATPASSTVRTMVGRLRAASSLAELLDEAARLLQALTGHDRVAVCRLGASGAAEVVAESRRSGLPSCLGQRIPGAELSEQARRSHRRSWVRMIADARAEPAAVVPSPVAEAEPLDLSLSVLRSASPSCAQRLAGLGVRGAMSVPVIVSDRLWGLLVCHHREPLAVPGDSRTSAELFAQVLSLLVEAREHEEAAVYEARAQSLHRRLMSTLAAEATTAQNVAAYFDEMQQVLRCHGVGISIDGDIALSGEAPSRAEFDGVVRFLQEAAGSRLYASHHLGAVYGEGARLLPRVAGLLAVPVSRTPRDYLVFFRSEVQGGQCEPWSPAEQRFAEALRVTILEVILTLTEVAARDRERAQRKQELLIGELNHRVRNILALLRAIVGQSREGAESVEGFAEVLGDRIQSLARAHDQITRDHWGPAPLRGLIEAEAAAYLADKAERVRLTGPDILLRPQAFSTLALVVHELVTNAAKHGALSDGHGAIAVDWRVAVSGDLLIDWRESGGGPVAAPERRGFGSTIISRSVPYDLDGRAEVEFAPDGLKARFLIPADHLAPDPEPTPPAPAPVPTPAPAVAASSVRALVVEDSMILAIEAEDILRGLGFQTVDSAASVALSLHSIEAHRPDFAVLDVNLGRETSFPVAERLAELDVPFVFATGYGEQAVLPEAHAGRPRLSKPFSTDAFRRAVAACQPRPGEAGIQGSDR